MRYLISGYYGEGNLGDEAILAGILRQVRDRDPDAGFTVLSFDPEDTLNRHGVRASSTSLRDPRRWSRLLRGHDVLISGGGSFLHEADFDVYGRSFWLREGKLRPVPYFLAVVLLARLHRLPVVWYAQGLGPLHTWTSRRAVAALASVSRAVTWRDRDSAALAAEIGVAAPVEAVVPDPAYSLRPADGGWVDEALAAAGLTGGTPFIAVCLRPWLNRTAYQESIVAALSRETADPGLDVLFIPLQERLDLPLARALAGDGRWGGRAHVLEDVADPELISGILGRARLAVTMRLHAGILSAAAGTPAIPVSYDPKVTAFARQTRQEPWLVDVDDLERPGGAECLASALKDSLEREPARRTRLSRTVASLRTESELPAHLSVQAARESRAAREGRAARESGGARAGSAP